MKKTLTIAIALLALALAFMLPKAALADDPDATSGEATTPAEDSPWTIFPPAPADAADKNNAYWLTPGGWSFSLLMPSIGQMHLPTDSDWEGGDLSFQWFDDMNLIGTGGIFQIQGEFIAIQDEPLTEDQIAGLEAGVVEMLQTDFQGTVLGENPGVAVGGHVWNEIYYKEPPTEGEEGEVGILAYWMPEGNGIYLMYFYFDDPFNEIVPTDITIVLGGYEEPAEGTSA